MINVELSNIWSCASLPELLGSEKELFDAHLHLRTNSAVGNNFLGWLGHPEFLTAKLVHAIRTAAEQIRSGGDTLVVVGSGDSYLAAKAGIDLLLGRRRALLGKKPRILFTGSSLSSPEWLEVCELLSGHDYSLLVISPTGAEMEPAIASRGIRWMMERRYGPEAKEHIFIAALESSPMADMAKEEGYTLLPMPQELGGSCSALNSASLLPMAVAGIDPLAVLEGAAGAYRDMDLRAFENPAWMYAGARYVLSNRGKSTELLAAFDPNLASFSSWWRQYLCRHTCQEGLGIMPVSAEFTAELDAMDAMLQSGKYPIFETTLRLPGGGQKVNVEMDWKDYDALGYLAGKTLSDVEAATFDAMTAVHAYGDVPVVALECDQMDPEHLGELFYFFELSSALFACACGIEPFERQPLLPTRRQAERMLGKPET